jgi:hypothetical protein
VTLADLFAGVDPLRLEVRRHADVADDHIGIGLLCTGDERVVVLGHADDANVGVTAEHRAHAGANDRAVVSEEHSDLPHEATV